VEGLLAALRSVDPAVLAHRLREAIEVDVEARLAEVRVPVLYLAGADDRVVLARSFERIRRRLPAVERVVLPAPHLVLFARPREAAREILRFVDGRVGAS
jgi:pimeloyl-[acyl-carrier protein] methyl ester esterase